jgi:hypothetical protein
MPATADLSAGVPVSQPSCARTGRFRLSWKPEQLGVNALKTFRSPLLLCAAVACIAFGWTQALAYTDFGQGRPISAKDIAGKTICWSRKGVRANFAANGQYTDNQHRPGYRDQWSVPELGVLRVGYWHRQVEVLPDGRLHSYKYCLTCGDHDVDSWGTECN